MTLLCDQSSNIINLRDFINSLTDNIQDVSVRTVGGGQGEGRSTAPTPFGYGPALT